MNETCPFCGNPVDGSDRRNWQRVVAFQRIAGVRASGKHGGSDVVLRETRQEWAHHACVVLEKDKHRDQPSLFE